MTALKKRKANRLLHLIGAGLIGIYVYSPWAEIQWFDLLIKGVIIPLLLISGLMMWKPLWFQRNSKY